MPTRKELLQTKIDTNLESGTNITAVEHRDVESSIMNAAIPSNRGWFSVLDIQTTPIGTVLNRSGDIISATVINQVNVSVVSVYLATSMISNNYMVKIYIEGIGLDMNLDSTILCPTFRVISPTNLYINIKEFQTVVQGLKFHLEVVSLDY
jgi:hypothetical protein